MAYLTLGQFSIPITWIAFFGAILYSDFRNNSKDDLTNKVLHRLFWSYLVIWKVSYVLFAWDRFVQAPMSVLYFDGGLKGQILAMAVLAILLVKNRQVLDWQVLWQYWARFIALSQFIYFAFGQQWLLAAVWFVLIVLIEWKWQQWIFLAQWTLLLWIGGWENAFVIAHGMVILSVIIKKKTYQQLALVGLLSLIALTLTDIRTTTSTPAMAREPIDLMTTSNERYVLAEQEQTLTVVNFFATWCPPCQAEMPHLQSFAENLPEQVALIGVNLTARDDGTEALNDFMDKYKVSYPILLDETDQFGQSYAVMSIPTTVLLDANGQELERIVGPVSERVLREMIEKHNK